MVKYKQLCIRCKKNRVLISRYRQLPVCMDCQMKDVDKTVEDPIFKKLFDIPRDYYIENSFLRSIRSNYQRFGGLTKNQVEAFTKVVKDIKKGLKKAQKKTSAKL